MNPLSWPVVCGALIITSPALYGALVSGTVSLDVALVRLGLCAVGIWIVLSLAASLTTDALAATRRERADDAATEEMPTV
ncbi:hypothetical protein FB382_003324 [Nocardioides ginsengisegetis]|uniref:Uncharacterized protein n=1 Tax=Nocardioides ginsengisegetis TaxID=661491 RepID=A0A7W3PAX0_9ACTN|nr:hypothetical protein [Nocardioides ginsengisegetis]MBA8805033.1 hypothetical protein [Nocardioides ginsengisegetis]